jgi:hypothetical protein
VLLRSRRIADELRVLLAMLALRSSVPSVRQLQERVRAQLSVLPGIAANRIDG